MLKKIQDRLPLLIDYRLENWGKQGFGEQKKDGKFIVKDGYAIMGFWRDKEWLRLNGIKWVLTGKGILGHSAK